MVSFEDSGNGSLNISLRIHEELRKLVSEPKGDNVYLLSNIYQQHCAVNKEESWATEFIVIWYER